MTPNRTSRPGQEAIAALRDTPGAKLVPLAETACRSSPSSCLLLGQPADFSRLVSIGRVRMRLAVAAKIAFVTAGATAAVGASPKPPGASELLTRYVSTTGVSSIRSGR